MMRKASHPIIAGRAYRGIRRHHARYHQKAKLDPALDVNLGWPALVQSPAVDIGLDVPISKWAGGQIRPVGSVPLFLVVRAGRRCRQNHDGSRRPRSISQDGRILFAGAQSRVRMRVADPIHHYKRRIRCAPRAQGFAGLASTPGWKYGVPLSYAEDRRGRSIARQRLMPLSQWLFSDFERSHRP